MQIPLQVSVLGMPRSAALDARIEERARHLERFHPRITSCRVVVEQSARHQRQGREYAVRVEIRAPGHVGIAATGKHDEDVYVALRDAFEATERQLDEAIRERRDVV